MTDEQVQVAFDVCLALPGLDYLEGLEYVRTISGLSAGCWAAVVACWPELDWLRPSPLVETFQRGSIFERIWTFQGINATRWE